MKSRDIQLKEEILYLRNQLDIYVHKSLLKSDGVDILSDGEIPNLMPKRSNDCANEVTKNRSSQNNGNKTSSDIKKMRENDIWEKRTIYRVSITDLAKGVANVKRKIWFLVFFQEMTNEAKS